MGRSYAGTLGLAAFAAVLVRGVLRGGAIEATLQAAWIGLWGFAAVGFVAGRLAEWIVEESVTGKVAAELAAGAQAEAGSGERKP